MKPQKNGYEQYIEEMAYGPDPGKHFAEEIKRRAADLIRSDRWDTLEELEQQILEL